MDENTSFYSEELSFCDRRSATECVEILSETLDTQKLVENVIKSSPMLVPPSLNVSENIEAESCIKRQERMEMMESSELKRPTEYNPNTMECHKAARVENTVPQKWESSLTQAVRTVATDPDTFCRIPSRGAPSPMRSALTIAPAQPFNPQTQNIFEPVPLPEETVPYFPPEHPILPVKKESETKKPPIPKPKSPFVRALETAPDRPFTPAGGGAATPAPPPVKKKSKDPLDVLLGELPRPTEKIDMRSALTTAPERPYSPLTIEQHMVSQETTISKRGSLKSTDRSCLTKPLKPEELPKSFKMNEAKPKPPSYYAPVVIEERIKAESEESRRAVESKQTKIIEQQTIQPGRVSQQVIQQEAPPTATPTAFAPIFQGFSCSFKNKSDITEFSVEVSTTPPIPTPPPKPQTPQSYIATVEEKPTRITTQKIFEERSGLQQTTSKRQENVRTEIKQQAHQDVQKQAEEVVKVKPLPVTSLLHKPDTLPAYQKELKATAEADLILMERRQKAQERLEEQKRQQCIIQKQQQQTQEMQQQSIRAENICKKEETIRKEVPSKPERCNVNPVIRVESDDSVPATSSASFQPVSDKPPSTTFSPRPRSITPSMINKAPPLIPYYQDNLVAHYHTAVETNILDPTTPERSRSPSPRPDARSRSPSPFPSRHERAKSPAQGPPPNPLQSRKPLPTPQDSKVKKAKENVQTYLSGYRSQEEVMGHTFVRGSETESVKEKVNVNQNVAYPVSSVGGQLCVQTGKVQQQVDSREKQKMQLTEAQKHESQIDRFAGGCSKTDISEKTRQEQLAAERQSQSQSVLTSADGRTQIQRKKMVTEEYERSHKETNIQIEKNISSCTVSKKNQFSKVNVPTNGGPVAQSFHVTNPRHMTSFESKELLSSQQESQKVDTQHTLQQASQKLSQSCQSQTAPTSCPTTQPAVRHVYAPSSIAPVKHVSSPNCNRKPCQNITKPNVPAPNVGSGTGRQAGGISVAPKRGRGVLNPGTLGGGSRIALCGHCHTQVR